MQESLPVKNIDFPNQSLLGTQIISSKEKNISRMDSIIKESLQKAITFPEYKEMVSQLIEEGKSTGPNQSDELLNYSKLNDRRMARLHKTLKIDEVSQNYISNIEQGQTWILITESWCGDAAQTTPMIHKVAELSENIDLQVVLRDENEGFINQFLTNGNKAIPILVILDTNSNEVVGQWGPRPKTATKLVNDYKAENGGLDAQFKEDLQKWYNKDKGKDTLEDLLEVLKQVETKNLKKVS